MKVAIIGGGMSGMACAHELEKLGVKPEIYEKKGYIGEPMDHVAAILEISHRPIRDALKYIKEKYGIDIKPLNKINKLIHYSPNVRTDVSGDNLGYLVDNTSGPMSAKKQLLGQLKHTGIRLNQDSQLSALQREYDHVVVANGGPMISKELGVWQEWSVGYVRGAVVMGEFDPQALVMWIHRDYCKNGYAYLAPFNENKAALILVTTDVNEKEIDHYWELFLDSENIRYPMVEEFKLEHRTGFVYPLQVENVIFVGNAFGALDAFLGFGFLHSVVSGVGAARTIVKGIDYEKQMKSVIHRNKDMREFRKTFNTMTNKGYDNLLMAMKLPGFRKIVYNFPVNIDYVKMWGALSRIFMRQKQGR